MRYSNLTSILYLYLLSLGTLIGVYVLYTIPSPVRVPVFLSGCKWLTQGMITWHQLSQLVFFQDVEKWSPKVQEGVWHVSVICPFHADRVPFHFQVFITDHQKLSSLQITEICFSGFGGLYGTSSFEVWKGLPSHSQQYHLALQRWKGLSSSLWPLWKALTPLTVMEPSSLSHFPNPHLLMPPTWGKRVQYVSLGTREQHLS